MRGQFSANVVPQKTIDFLEYFCNNSYGTLTVKGIVGNAYGK